MKRRVLLVGWDAADWKVIAPLVDAGRMPHTAGLIERGTMGNLATLNPVLSPMLWTSIATGKRPYKHGIHGFSEPDPDTGAVRPITNLSRRTKAIWNILNQRKKKSLVVGWWPSSPAEPIRGAMVSNHFQQAVAPRDKPWPMRRGTVHPPDLAGELAALRIHPHELEGDMLRSFVPRAPEIDQQQDTRLGMVAKILAECSSVHAAATHLMGDKQDWDFAAVYYDAIDHFGHGFMKYHPPRLDWVVEEDFEIYEHVVNAGYIYHDMMLGTLLELAGPETTVILMSDHGFHPDHLRPRNLPNEPAGPAAEHRDIGVFVACGPGIKKDELVFGASLLDVTPTILSLFGLPTGRDMDGRVLTSIYEEPPKVEYIDSWDAVPGDDGRHPPDTRIDPIDAKEAIRQLVDLGYIDEPDADAGKAVEETTRELRYNLARAFVDGGRRAEAIRIFTELWERWPAESRFGVQLLQVQLESDLVLEARETMTLLRERKNTAAVESAEVLKSLIAGIGRKQAEGSENDPRLEPGGNGELAIDWDRVSEGEMRRVRKLRSRCGTNMRAFAFLEGSLLHLEGRYDESLEMLGHAVEAQTSNLPSLHRKMGEVCLSKRDWKNAAEQFAKVIALDPLNAQGHYGLARVAMHRGDWTSAASSAMSCTGQQFNHAAAHYLAGMALWRLGFNDEALHALQRAVSINPVFPAAHRSLAGFHLRVRSDRSAHATHRRLARQARQRILAQQAVGLPDEIHPLEYRESFGTEDAAGVGEVPPPRLPPRDETIVVVTGLPRSGTSMAMQMLQAGGVPVLADGQRPADDSNERGYLEYEAVKGLARDSGWLAVSKGRAVKVVTQLLPHLPQEHRYRFIMMHRPLREIVASQKKMLKRLGRQGASITDDALMETFGRQVSQVRMLLKHLRRRGVLDVLDLTYHEVLEDPVGAAAEMAAFLGAPFDSAAAAAVVAAELCHERDSR